MPLPGEAGERATAQLVGHARPCPWFDFGVRVLSDLTSSSSLEPLSASSLSCSSSTASSSVRHRSSHRLAGPRASEGPPRRTEPIRAVLGGALRSGVESSIASRAPLPPAATTALTSGNGSERPAVRATRPGGRSFSQPPLPRRRPPAGSPTSARSRPLGRAKRRASAAARLGRSAPRWWSPLSLAGG